MFPKQEIQIQPIASFAAAGGHEAFCFEQFLEICNAWRVTLEF